MSVLLPVATLLGGVALGWGLHPDATSTAPAKPESRKVHESKNVKDVGGDSARDALRRRVKELERELAAALSIRSKPPEKTSSGDGSRVDAHRHREPPHDPAEFRARMEELRKNDPERYAQMTNGMARFRSSGLRRAANRLETLASVDTSCMTKAEFAAHQKYQNLIAREQELLEIGRPDNAETTDQDRADAWKELHELWREKRDLERVERDMLLSKTAEAYGISGSDANELVDTVKAVYEATQSGWGGPPGPPHSRRHGTRGHHGSR